MVLLDENTIKRKKYVKKTNAVLDEKNLKSTKELVEKKAKVKASFAEICPIVDVTNNDFFEMKNGEFLEIIQVSSKDIYALNEMDKNNDIKNLSNFLLAYTYDFKIVPLNTPMNLQKQKDHLYKKIKKNQSEAYKPFLEIRLRELEYLEKNRTNREYFIFLYADEERVLLDRMSHVKILFVRSNPILELTFEKKVGILFQLFNPNTKPINN